MYSHILPVEKQNVGNFSGQLRSLSKNTTKPATSIILLFVELYNVATARSASTGAFSEDRTSIKRELGRYIRLRCRVFGGIRCSFSSFSTTIREYKRYTHFPLCPRYHSIRLLFECSDAIILVSVKTRM